jgi:hypothetical protein
MELSIEPETPLSDNTKHLLTAIFTSFIFLGSFQELLTESVVRNGDFLVSIKYERFRRNRFWNVTTLVPWLMHFNELEVMRIAGLFLEGLQCPSFSANVIANTRSAKLLVCCRTQLSSNSTCSILLDLLWICCTVFRFVLQLFDLLWTNRKPYSTASICCGFIELSKSCAFLVGLQWICCEYAVQLVQLVVQQIEQVELEL